MGSRMLRMLVVSMLAAPAATGQVHGGDVILGFDGGRIVTGALDPGVPEPRFPEQVFGGELDPVTHFGDEPGFDSEPGTFPPLTSVGFTIRRALRAWDGSAFGVVPAERLEIRRGSLGPVLTPTLDEPVVGFGLLVNAQGELHAHLGFSLLAPAGAGIYLLELEMWHQSPASAVSRPFWIVLNHGEDEPTHEAAMEHVYLTRVCPADRTLDRTVDFNDVLAFLNEFNEGRPGADLNGDGAIDFNDVLVFLNFYNGPCPVQ